jgi:hypothetical protein
MALDFETNTTKSGGKKLKTMTLAQARQFVEQIVADTGSYPLLYSFSPFLIAQLKELDGKIDPVLSQCPLWLARYHPDADEPKIPKGWAHWTLWQYTGDGQGHGAMKVPGIKNRKGEDDDVERDYFIGKLTELETYWGNNLNAGDIEPNPNGLVEKPAFLEALAPTVVPATDDWRAVFHMDLADSHDLLRGTLSLYAPNGDSVHKFTAACGARRHQSENDLWSKDRGPVPPNPNTGIGNGLETRRHKGNKVKHGYRITPEAVTELIPPHTTRDAFRVHFDNGNDGSAGCIALTHEKEWHQFVGLMEQLQGDGVKWMPLILNYV